MATEEDWVSMEGSTIDAAVRAACTAAAQGGDDAKIEFELAGIVWRLRVEAVGVASDNDDEEED